MKVRDPRRRPALPSFGGQAGGGGRKRCAPFVKQKQRDAAPKIILSAIVPATGHSLAVRCMVPSGAGVENGNSG